MLRRLGRLAMEALAKRGRLDLDDPRARILLDELRRTDREIAFLLDRLKCLQGGSPLRDEALPPAPGTDSHFPFSR
jgi:hypothetical protein